MTIKELMDKYRYNIKQLSDRFSIPYRTVQNWASGQRECADYIVKMMDEILKKEGRKNMFIAGDVSLLNEEVKNRLVEVAKNYNDDEYDRFNDEVGYEDWMDDFVENPDEELTEREVEKIDRILKQVWDLAH